MSQVDEKELSEIGRSIDSLFARVEAPENGAPAPVAVADPPPAVEAASEVEDQPAAVAEPDLASESGLPSEPDPLAGALEPPEPESTATEVASGLPSEPDPLAGALVPPEPESTASGVAPDLPFEPAPSAEGGEPPEATSSEGRGLREATTRYLQVPVGERVEEQSALRSAAVLARSADDLDEIAVTVDALLLEAAWDEDVESLVGELVDGEVAAQLVVRLGQVQVDEERRRLIRAYAILGDSVAKAMATALTETEDRMARKTFVEALGAFGSAGANAVELMMEDSRWFVVRNGVSVLGVAGGPNAVELLTSSLANEHAEVRRETVRSLAKIGGENAGLLICSMLGDSDPEVRAEAARAVAVLKPERAFKSLVEILKKGDEDEVIEQVFRALGALGDASAVTDIEKRMKGSLFRKPPKGVRIAGLSALAMIGTPHAVSVVEKARDHKDAEISSAAKELLAGRPSLQQLSDGSY